MPKVHYIDYEGKKTTVDIACGVSVMHGALLNMVDGILAECGGALTCATCHCYIDEGWFEKTGTISGQEDVKLSQVPIRKTTSRLSCQIIMSAELDGIIVRLPENQLRV